MSVCYYDEIVFACNTIGLRITSQCLYVSVKDQRMYFYSEARFESTYVISTAVKGISQIQDSDGTPLGLHEIADKIGEGIPWGTVFIGRKNTGKIFTEYGDWETKGYVTSRILRLKGLQEGYNLGGNCDTYSRYIYIHGITNEKKIGIPWTCGCIGMRNSDIIELFPKIAAHSLVFISEK
ncbi:MAG: L,D-transpeptidase [Puniceicoccales bacterium]|nr:L,D-transpeptidase [Puniceicoccales bacterium]